MTWEMEMEEIEAVLDKIWDLHDKLSDAIHSISRTHFLNSTKSLRNTPDNNFKNKKPHHFYDNDAKNKSTNGFVFVKDYDKDFSAIAEAKSLNSIRSALENLEDQLEFFHTVQLKQRAERDAALAQLEQSRIILALRLAEHQGKRHKVIDEAMEFVGDVRHASCFIGPENLSNPPASAPVGVKPNIFVRVLLFGLDSTKRTLQLDKMGGLLGNAALFALSMLAFLHLHQVTCKDNELQIGHKQDRLDGSSSSGRLSNLDVRLARG